MSTDILTHIIAAKKVQIAPIKRKIPITELKKQIEYLPPPYDFKKAITLADKLNLIAEIKRASPSRGKIKPKLNLNQTVIEYMRSGAAAISVLTEEKYFSGTLTDLIQVRKLTKLPILRKDFIFDEYQIYETRVAGADAYLLIAAILTEKEIASLIYRGKQIGLTAVVEVHTEQELKTVLRTPVEIIGINNRDLHNFQVNLNTCLRLRPLIPKKRVCIAESGIKTSQDVNLLRQARFNAVLIGETLISAKSIPQAVEQLKLGLFA